MRSASMDRLAPLGALQAALQERASLAKLLAVALLARVLSLSVAPLVFNDTVGFHGPTFVPLSYRYLALAILHWDFSGDLGARSPGYPAFMALGFRLFGLDNWQAIAGMQALLSLALFFSAYWLWSQIYGKGRAALFATAVVVLEPAVVLAERGIASESLSVVLLVLCLPLLFHAARRESPWTAAASGLALAWLGLTRPAFQVLIPLFLVYLAVRLGARWRSPRGLGCLAALALAAGLPVAAWSGFNYVRFGFFTPMTIQGDVLTSHSLPIVEKHPERYAKYADVVRILERYRRPGGAMPIWVAYPEIMKARNLSFTQVSLLMQRLSLQAFRDSPLQYARSVSAAFARFWQGFLVGEDAGPTKSVALVIAKRLYALVYGAAVALYFCVAALDLARLRRWREPGILERLLLLSIVGLVCFASTVPTIGDNFRYHVPLLPLIWGVAAGSLAANWPRLRELLASWK